MYEKRVELMYFLNDNMIHPSNDVILIANIFNIEFIDTDEIHGWEMTE